MWGSSAVVGKIYRDDHDDYLDQVDDFVLWWDPNFPDLNVKKSTRDGIGLLKNSILHTTACYKI